MSYISEKTKENVGVEHSEGRMSGGHVRGVRFPQRHKVGSLLSPSVRTSTSSSESQVPASRHTDAPQHSEIARVWPLLSYRVPYRNARFDACVVNQVNELFGATHGHVTVRGYRHR